LYSLATGGRNGEQAKSQKFTASSPW